MRNYLIYYAHNKIEIIFNRLNKFDTISLLPPLKMSQTCHGFRCGGKMEISQISTGDSNVTQVVSGLSSPEGIIVKQTNDVTEVKKTPFASTTRCCVTVDEDKLDDLRRSPVIVTVESVAHGDVSSGKSAVLIVEANRNQLALLKGKKVIRNFYSLD